MGSVKVIEMQSKLTIMLWIMDSVLYIGDLNDFKNMSQDSL